VAALDAPVEVNLARGMPRQLPAVLLGPLALDRSLHGQGLDGAFTEGLERRHRSKFGYGQTRTPHSHRDRLWPCTDRRSATLRSS
jgi:predicted N-acetyltransferase YhbS